MAVSWMIASSSTSSATSRGKAAAVGESAALLDRANFARLVLGWLAGW